MKVLDKLISIGILVTTASAPAVATSEHTALVRFKDDSTRASLGRATRVFDALNIEIDDFASEIGVFVVKHKTSAGLSSAIKQLRELDSIAYVDENVRFEAFTEPNDPRYSEKNGLKSLNLPEAWNTSTGDRNIVVAVIDSGVDVKHEDLAGNIWVNDGEVAGNDFDDDGNGYIDDVNGWDFVDGDHIADDELGHGTHVAGIIGAVGNNRVGVTGVNWNVSIMAIRFLDAQGGGDLNHSVKAILYAVNNGAHVINASWGGDQMPDSLKDAIQYANDNGVLFVAAAGNSGDSRVLYPAGYDIPSVVSVASSDRSGTISNFSTFGPHVHVIAPGKEILSTVPGGYDSFSGTSMASPMVAGLAALILSRNASLAPVDLRNLIFDSINFSEGYVGSVATMGDLDAGAALRSMNSPQFRVIPRYLTIISGKSFQFTVRGDSRPTWSVDPAELASIDASGLLTTNGVGSVTVQATAAGEVATTTRVDIVEAAAVGCGALPFPIPIGGTSEETAQFAGAVGSLGLPFAAGLFAFGGSRFRRRRKKSMKRTK